MSQKKFPLGIQTFSEIINGNCYYADKTDMVYDLAHYAKFFFLSRPRRFGKSLFLSTLQAYFEGRKELFKGLKIDSLESEWTRHPVIHIDLSIAKYYDTNNLRTALDCILSQHEERYGIKSTPEETYSIRFSNIISTARKATGKQVVVLIDEYDAPMHDTVTNATLHNEIRNIMRDFFSPLKTQEANLRFVFITGISKFSQLSIFSELNNLKIISMKDKYSSICGITSEELTSCFHDAIEEMARHNKLTVEETVSRLKTHYDGYHFSAGSEDIFNPYSIINALDDKEFTNYWFSSGTPTFLIDLLQKHNIDILQLNELWVKDSRFDAPTDTLTDPVPVLYQSGYLTIKEYDRERQLYRLSFPNDEVRQGFSESLVKHYTANCMSRFDSIVLAYANHIMTNECMADFMPHLKAFYDKFPYTIINNNEKHYQAVMFTILTMLGADVQAEYATPDGRIDLVMKTKENIYIFELKCDKDAEEAMKQIKTKDYAKAFATDGRSITTIGISFSKNSRSITDWTITQNPAR